MLTFLLCDDATASPCNNDGVLAVWLARSWYRVPPSQRRAIKLPTTRGYEHGHGKTVQQRPGRIGAMGNTTQRLAGARMHGFLVYVNVRCGKILLVPRLV